MEVYLIAWKLIWMAATFLVVIKIYWSLTAWIYRSIKGNIKLLLSPIIAPGVFLHESSHLLLAMVFCRKILSVRFFTFDHESGELGHVKYAHRSRGPFTFIADLFIAIAPLSGGILGVILISNWLLNPEVLDFTMGELRTILLDTPPFDPDFWIETINLYFYILTNISYSLKEILWLFLLISISHAACPSAADLKLSLPGFLLVSALFVTYAFLFPDQIQDINNLMDYYYRFLIAITISIAAPLIILLFVAGFIKGFFWLTAYKLSRCS